MAPETVAGLDEYFGITFGGMGRRFDNQIFFAAADAVASTLGGTG